MGQKVSPIGFRTGITIGWKSRWFAPKSNFGEFLVEDAVVRRFIDERMNRQPPYAAVSDIEIERTREEVKVILKTARPGLVIGPKGAEVDKLKVALEDVTNRRVSINIVEIRNPDLNAKLVAEGIAEQLKRRSSFRRTMKQRAAGTMQAGAKGIKIQISGRLGGSEMSRTETTLVGSIPLHTLDADVDYGFVPCFTTYGVIGVKVWIYRGRFGEQVSEEEQGSRYGDGRPRRRRERTGDSPHSRRGGPGGSFGPASVRPGGSRVPKRPLGPTAAPAPKKPPAGQDPPAQAPPGQPPESAASGSSEAEG